jgi:tetratricopeptide (TPR) repeat protein
MHRATLSIFALALVACNAPNSTHPSAGSEADAGPCSDFERDVERHWSSERKAEVRAAIIAANSNYGKNVAERVVRLMDANTQDWVMMRETICGDTVVRKSMPVEVYNKISTCLLGNLAQQRRWVIVAASPRPDQLDQLEWALHTVGIDMRLCSKKAVYGYYEPDELDARKLLEEAKLMRRVGDDAGAEDAANRALALAEQSKALGLRVDAWIEKAWEAFSMADYAGARISVDLALSTAEEGGYELGVANAAMLRGRIEDVMGDNDGALEYARRALAIQEKVLGTEHPYTAISYNDIGVAYEEKGQYDDALEWHRKALAIRENVFGTEDANVAASYNNIGVAYNKKGESDDALEWHRKALAVREKVLGTEHLDTATSYNNIGAVYVNKGSYAKALEWLRKALAIREKVLGTDHPDTATSYSNIGAAYINEEDYDKALEWYRKALAIEEKVLGTDHPDTATSYNNIGVAHYNKGEYERALEWLRKALAIREKVLGTDHPETATSYNNIGVAHVNQGEYDKALESYRKALAIQEKVLGTYHPSTTGTQNNIAWLCKKYAPACSFVR